tara:strand:- start:342 stop:830 length:489 start_codon:yes stop_codon:yes gene_type:complete
MVCSVEIVALFVSKGHDFKGRHGLGRSHHEISSPKSVECIKGKGIPGDRYFDFKENYKAQVTFFDEGVHESVQKKFSSNYSPEVYRRNVLTRGLDLNKLIGKCFRLGEIEFEGVEECTPCYWMDEVVAPGAEKFLMGQGGLRTRVLSDGNLQLGLVELIIRP